MYYRRQLPIMSGVYRPLETRRFVMMDMGGYWPVLQKLPNGHLGVVTRDSDFHIGARGRLVFVTSPDGGESWSHATVISERGPDDRNPAFGVTVDGTLLACFIRADRYVDGNWTPEKDRGGYTPMWMSRSEDGGATWSEAELVDGQGHEQWSYAGRTGPDDHHRYSSAFGKMLTLADGTILMGYAINTTEQPKLGNGAFLVRSHDGGRTWVDCVTMAEGYGEPALFHVGGERFLVMLRGTTDFTGLAQIDSEDGGYTWSEPRKLTLNAEHPGDVIRLQDGRILLTYGRRVTPYGIQGMVSDDDGKTWNQNSKIFLVGDSGTDQGYPSSVQLDDGTIVTVYYSSELRIPRQPRPEVLGVHGAAVLYRPEDL